MNQRSTLNSWTAKFMFSGFLSGLKGTQGLNPYLFAADQPPPISAPIAAGYLKSRGSYRAHACILLHIGHPEVASHIAFEGPEHDLPCRSGPALGRPTVGMAAPPFFTTAYRTLTSAVWICRGRDAPPQTKSTTWNPRRSVATSVHAHTLSPSFSCFSFQYSDSMTALLAKSIGPQQSWQVLTFVAVRKVTKRPDLV
jgi:hypothetical protein